MSVLNDMLRDLQARDEQSTAAGLDALDDLDAAPPRRRRGRMLLVLLLGGVLTAALVAALDMVRGLPGFEGGPEATAEIPSPVAAGELLPPVSEPTTVDDRKLEAPAPVSPQQVATPDLRRPAPQEPEPAAVRVAQDSPPASATTPVPESAPAADAAPPESATPEETDPAPVMERQPSRLEPAEAARRAHGEALEALRAGNQRQAEEYLREALEHDAGFAESRLALARLLLRQARQREAVGVLQAGLERTPDHAGLALLAGRLRLEAGDSRGAIGILEPAAPPVRADPSFHTVLAAAYQRSGAHETAAGQYRQLLGLEERGAWWLGLAVSLERLEQHQEAWEAYQRALSRGGLSQAAADYADRALERLARYGAPE